MVTQGKGSQNMGQSDKRAYLLAICKRYHHAKRQEKSRILDEYCAVCGYNRKYAIRRLRSSYKRLRRGELPTAKPGPKLTYDPVELLDPLKAIWFASRQVCSKHLKHALPQWLPFYEKHHGALSDTIRTKLLAMSPATIDRMLKPIRVTHSKGLSGTKPGTLLKNQIPIRTHNWDITKPGFNEADTVALCGDSLTGEFIWCLTFTDIATTWTQVRAVWGKGSAGVLDAIKDIESGLPFELLGVDCDNGTEFLNHHLLRYLHDRKSPVAFTRSRPYKKNDNAHVEQKNYTHVRSLLGYDRYEKSAAVAPMNDMFINTFCVLRNHFIPASKLVTKTRIGSKYKKYYDTPTTAYQRVMNSTDVSQEEKDKLQATHEQLDPFELIKQLHARMKLVTSYAKHQRKSRSGW